MKSPKLMICAVAAAAAGVVFAQTTTVTPRTEQLRSDVPAVTTTLPSATVTTTPPSATVTTPRATDSTGTTIDRMNRDAAAGSTSTTTGTPARNADGSLMRPSTERGTVGTERAVRTPRADRN